MKTFEEWFKTIAPNCNPIRSPLYKKQLSIAWDYQQKRIDKLEDLLIKENKDRSYQGRFSRRSPNKFIEKIFSILSCTREFGIRITKNETVVYIDGLQILHVIEPSGTRNSEEVGK